MKRFFSLRWFLPVAVAVLMASSAALTVFMNSEYADRFISRLAADGVIRRVERLVIEVESTYRPYSAMDLSGLPATLAVRISERVESRWALIDLDGTAVFLSDADITLPSAAYLSEKLFENEPDIFFAEEQWRVISPVYDDQSILIAGLYIESVVPLIRREREWVDAAQAEALQYTLLAILALALAGGYLVARAVLKSVDRLSTRIERIPRDEALSLGNVPVFDEGRRLHQAIERASRAVIEGHERQRAALALRSELIANVGHDLRAPLSVLSAQIDALSRSMARSEKAVDQLRRTRQSLKLLDDLVHDLFALAQLQDPTFTVRREPILLGELWDHVVATVAGDVQDGFIWTGGADADEPILGDGLLLTRALRNVLENARQYGGNSVRIEGGLHRDVATGAVILWVEDNGPGIDPSEWESVFERYYRGNAPRTPGQQGSGLGLPIVRAVMRAHQGDARVCQPSAGTGTRVEMQFNAVSAEAS